MKGEEIHLQQSWTVGARIGGGGFGEVYALEPVELSAVAKFVKKDPGADRELLFVDVDGLKNVIPIIDVGEHGDYWVLVMPRAEMSLRDYLAKAGGRIELSDALVILADIAEALVSLDGRVVHRDLKPENILLYEGVWCLADFGISRYAEATTAPDTQKYALSAPYAAPERWRAERATIATDVYSTGVMAYEMVRGSLPFVGPTQADFRDQHLHQTPPVLESVPPRFASVVNECMFKAPGARPTPSILLNRLTAVPNVAVTGGLAALAEANLSEVERIGSESRSASESRTAAERRSALAEAARATFESISGQMSDAIQSTATAARLTHGRNGEWTVQLGDARLRMYPPRDHEQDAWGGWEAPAFDVVATSQIDLRIPPNRTGYEGRSHSLWYCDAVVANDFAWYEVAFMITPMLPRRGRQDPFALDPGEESAKAIWNGMAEYQLAWPFTRIVAGDHDELVDRWAGWFALASRGRLQHPSRMPEVDGVNESYRRG